MTKQEAQELKRFDELCTCGGHAYRMNGRPPEQPHRLWCPQFSQYGEWYRAMNPEPTR